MSIVKFPGANDSTETPLTLEEFDAAIEYIRNRVVDGEVSAVTLLVQVDEGYAIEIIGDPDPAELNLSLDAMKLRILDSLFGED